MKPFALVGLSLLLVLGCLLLAIASGFGHRLQLWGFATGFKLLAGAVIGASVGTVLALVAGFLAWRNASPSSLYWSITAFVLGLIALAPPLSWAWAVRQLPHIHDISTDTENPPGFAAILRQRANAPNTAEYGGIEVARLQQQAYPDIKPLHFPLSPQQTFAAALEAARSLGWRIIERHAETGRIEASDKTFWFGFIDDVVIRVTPLSENESRVDVRSVSRVGQSDVGTNAARIRKFRSALTERTVRTSQ